MISGWLALYLFCGWIVQSVCVLLEAREMKWNRRPALLTGDMLLVFGIFWPLTAIAAACLIVSKLIWGREAVTHWVNSRKPRGLR